MPSGVPITAFLETVAPRRRAEAEILLPLMERASGASPVMWGPSIIGFGRYAYRYDSGRSGEYFLTGFAPRKAHMTLYIMDGFTSHAEDLALLGRHRLGRSCLYLTRLANADPEILERIVTHSVAAMRQKYPDAP